MSRLGATVRTLPWMDPSGIDLYWLPLGAGGWFVRLNGRVYEALMAARDRRPRADLSTRR